MSADEFGISKDDQATLQHLSDILHLFHHRNHNQHRRSIWWRHFSVFRKHVSKLVADLEDLKEVPPTQLARIQKKARDQQTRTTMERNLVFWRDVLVPKWQHAFSQVIADGRFAVLGLTLIAILAEVCRILGITAIYEEMGQLEVEKVLERFAEEGWEGRDGDPRGLTTSGQEDQGEVIVRGATDAGSPISQPAARVATRKPEPVGSGAVPRAEPKGPKRSRVSSESLMKKRKKGKKGRRN